MSAETGNPRYHHKSQPQGVRKPAGWVIELYKHPRGGPIIQNKPAARPIEVVKNGPRVISPAELLSNIDANAARGKLSDTGPH